MTAWTKILGGAVGAAFLGFVFYWNSHGTMTPEQTFERAVGLTPPSSVSHLQAERISGIDANILLTFCISSNDLSRILAANAYTVLDPTTSMYTKYTNEIYPRIKGALASLRERQSVYRHHDTTSTCYKYIITDASFTNACFYLLDY